MKNVLITGGTSGIGLASAKKLLQNESVNVGIVGRSSERGKNALEFLNSSKAVYIQGDVSVPTSCFDIVKEFIDIFGSLDCLINSAGIYHEGGISSVNERIFYDVVNTNIKGTFFMCQAVIDELKATHGNIVNISSDAGIHGNYFCSLYSASKGAIVAFTRSLALELSPDVRVNCICPGDVDTPMTEEQFKRSGMNRDEFYSEMSSIYPMKRIASAEEIANVVSFLSSTDASFVTGAVIAVDGGLSA